MIGTSNQYALHMIVLPVYVPLSKCPVVPLMQLVGLYCRLANDDPDTRWEPEKILSLQRCYMQTCGEVTHFVNRVLVDDDIEVGAVTRLSRTHNKTKISDCSNILFVVKFAAGSTLWFDYCQIFCIFSRISIRSFYLLLLFFLLNHKMHKVDFSSLTADLHCF